MNIPWLASQIVARVHKSPDSITNLEAVVCQLIREEQARDKAVMESGMIEMGFKHRTED